MLLCYYYWYWTESRMMNRTTRKASKGGIPSNGTCNGTQKGAAIACLNM